MATPTKKEMTFVCEPHHDCGWLYTHGHTTDYVAFNLPAKYWRAFNGMMNYALRLTAEGKMKNNDLCETNGVLFIVSDASPAFRAKITGSVSGDVGNHLRLATVLQMDKSVVGESPSTECSCCGVCVGCR